MPLYTTKLLSLTFSQTHTHTHLHIYPHTFAQHASSPELCVGNHLITVTCANKLIHTKMQISFTKTPVPNHVLWTISIQKNLLWDTLHKAHIKTEAIHDRQPFWWQVKHITAGIMMTNGHNLTLNQAYHHRYQIPQLTTSHTTTGMTIIKSHNLTTTVQHTVITT